MNIALVIFRIGPSHGSILQTYALKTCIERFGHNVTIIDRQTKVPFTRVIIRAIFNLKAKLKGNYKGPIFYRGGRPKVIMKNLDRFVDKYLSKCMQTVYSDQDLIDIQKKNKFDAFIVGSDQTWRPKYVSNIYYYYLDFVKNKHVKRIAYAPSFGTDNWEYSKEEELRCKQLVQKFDAVSVREKTAVILCKAHFNIETTWVLDPTMLLEKEDYEKIIKKDNDKNKTLAFSILDNSKTKEDIVDRVCKELHLTPHRVNARDERQDACLQDRICPGIDTWLSGIMNSSFVVADSFHATVFAIIFNKPFITIGNMNRGLSRFQSLLSSFDLNDRLITTPEEINEKLLKERIDWGRINYVMSEYRKTSIQFLQNNLVG